MVLAAGTIVYMQMRVNQDQEKPCPDCVVKNEPVMSVIKTTQPVAKKTLVFLYSDDCSFCEKMKPVVDSITAKGYNVQQINVITTTKYNATETPTSIVLQDGKEIARFVGVTSEQSLLDALKI